MIFNVNILTHSLTFKPIFVRPSKKKFAFRFNFENPQKKNLDKDLALDLMNLLLKDRNIPEDHMKYFAGKLLDLKRKVIFFNLCQEYLLTYFKTSYFISKRIFTSNKR